MYMYLEKMLSESCEVTSLDLSSAVVLYSRVPVLKQRLKHQQVSLCASFPSCSSPPQAIYCYKSSARAKGRTVIMTGHWGVKEAGSTTGKVCQCYMRILETVKTGQSFKCLTRRERMCIRQPVLGLTWKYVHFVTCHLRPCRAEMGFFSCCKLDKRSTHNTKQTWSEGKQWPDDFWGVFY